jgi:hypothetical protein
MGTRLIPEERKGRRSVPGWFRVFVRPGFLRSTNVEYKVMKKLIMVIAAAAAAVLSGCIVTSVCPFYTQNDLVFEPGIVGNWINLKSDGEVWKFDRSSDLAYRFTQIEENKATVMEAHAFKLQGQLLLEIASMERDTHVIPPRYLLKVRQLAPTLQLSELNHEWLKDLLADKPARLHHCLVQNGDKPENRRVVLTGDTAELQAFVIAHLKDGAAWKDSFDLKREPSALTAERTAQR